MRWSRECRVRRQASCWGGVAPKGLVSLSQCGHKVVGKARPLAAILGKRHFGITVGELRADELGLFALKSQPVPSPRIPAVVPSLPTTHPSSAGDRGSVRAVAVRCSRAGEFAAARGDPRLATRWSVCVGGTAPESELDRCVGVRCGDSKVALCADGGAAASTSSMSNPPSVWGAADNTSSNSSRRGGMRMTVRPHSHWRRLELLACQHRARRP